ISAYIDVLSTYRGEPRDVSLLTKTAVANVICSIIVGRRFEYDDAYFVTFIQKLDELFHLSESSSLFTVFPWLRYLPGDLFDAKRRTGIYRYIMDLFCYHYINKAKQDGEDVTESFITAYLQEEKKMKEQGQKSTLDDENLARNIIALFLAGTDTTSTLLQWFLLYMLHYPDAQSKIFAEISEVIGLERPPSLQDKFKLHLTNAAIIETQRISTTPFNLPHACNEDTVVKGYTIPAGATVITNLDSIFLNENIWKDPWTLKPNQPTNQLTLHVCELHSCYPGRRACPGESLAKMEIILFVTSLLQRFELRPEEPGRLPSLEPTQGMIFAPKPFKIRCVDRR
ncbi:hypothetical protein EGW08_023213, partial [Elysia chlorotica]